MRESRQGKFRFIFRTGLEVGFDAGKALGHGSAANDMRKKTFGERFDIEALRIAAAWAAESVILGCSEAALWHGSP